MKNILNKFHLNLATYFLFFLSFCCGYFKPICFLFLIVFVHELGHILFIKCFSYKLVKVEFYPFGGITTIEKPINSSLLKEMIISVAGCGMQIILFFLFLFLKKENILTDYDYHLLQSYNFILFFFNLLPIIPLDGSIFCHCLLEKIFPYETAFLGYEILSIVSFFLFFLCNIFFFHNYFMCIVLWMQFLILKKNEKYYIHRFYLERYLYQFPYSKIKNHEEQDIHKLKKETLHFFKEKNYYIPEKELLKRYFS